MGVTSKKLYNIKNDVLRKNINKIGVTNNTELLKLESKSEYDEVYRTLGVKSKQDFVNSQLKDSREINLYEQLFDDTVAFKGDYIKKMCNTYDLMILPISNIKGYLNDGAMKSIKEFTDKNEKTILSDSNFFILAGRECFYNKFKDKEVKTCIIFYRDKSNNTGSSSRKLKKTEIINQIYSSGNDFNMFRVFNQLFLTMRYTGGDGAPRWVSNLIISFLLLFVILFTIYGQILIGTITLAIYLGVMYLNNSVEEYKDCWNGYSSKHDYYI